MEKITAEEEEVNEGKLALILSDVQSQEGEELGELLGICVHAIAGSLAPKTMRLERFINHQKVLVLVDTGSTHSFVDPYVSRREKLSVGESNMKVKVANGDTIPCTGYCRVVTIELQHVKVNADLYVLPLGGCDVVLGVDWLRGLGSINWNFFDLIIKFDNGGKEIEFQGIEPPKEALEEKEHVPKLHKGPVKGIWLQMIQEEEEKKTQEKSST